MTSPTTSTPLSDVTMDTIITMVVRLKQPMTIKTESGEEYDILWNHEFRRPEVLKLGESSADILGIIQIIKWLERQSNDIEWFPQTKRHPQPND
jgi:hypothetical protein